MRRQAVIEDLRALALISLAALDQLDEPRSHRAGRSRHLCDTDADPVVVAAVHPVFWRHAASPLFNAFGLTVVVATVWRHRGAWVLMILDDMRIGLLLANLRTRLTTVVLDLSDSQRERRWWERLLDLLPPR